MVKITKNTNPKGSVTDRVGKKVKEMNKNSTKIVEKIPPVGDLSWYIKWVTVSLIVGTVICALAQLYLPMQIFGLLAAIGYFVVGLLWYDRSLMTASTIVATFLTSVIIQSLI